jgi:hypothetical protein
MSNEDLDRQFGQLLVRFVQFANEQGQASGAGPHMTGTALLFAAARFNAYLLARDAGTPDRFAARHNEALEHFRVQFERMMGDNLADFANHFDAYLPPPR